MATHRRAARCGHRRFDGTDRFSDSLRKTLVASSRDRDVQRDYYLRADPWRAERDSSRGHVARDAQRDGLWLRLGLVFLFQTERRCPFLRANEAMMVGEKIVRQAFPAAGGRIVRPLCLLGLLPTGRSDIILPDVQRCPPLLTVYDLDKPNDSV
jgi:hypothetical protein